MENFDPVQIVKDLIGKLHVLAKDGWEDIKSQAELGARKLAKQGQWILSSRITGALADDDLYEEFVQGLKDMTISYCNFLAAKTILTVETAWNVVVDGLWGAMQAALKAATGGWLELPRLD